MASQKIASNIWWRRPSIFLPAMAPPAQSEAIGQRLGWLDAPADAARQVADVDLFVAAVRRDGFSDVVLLGMGGAHTLVLVVSQETAGQRDLSTPGVSDRITEALKSRREQLLRTAFLTAARTDADVVNHLARRIVETQGKVNAQAVQAAPAKP
jgi:hypothetical protein